MIRRQRGEKTRSRDETNSSSRRRRRRRGETSRRKTGATIRTQRQ